MLPTLAILLTATCFTPPSDTASLANAAAMSFRFDPVATGPIAVPQDEQVPSTSPGLKLETITPPPTFGRKGSRRWYFHGGPGLAEDDNTFSLLGMGYAHFIGDGISLDLELNGMVFNQEGDDAEGGNLQLLLRWHIWQGRSWSIYAEAGIGILGTTDHVPEGASDFNFTPTAGGGFTIDLGSDVRLLVGARWHHISNANLYDNNPGRDSIFPYVGVSFPF